MNFRTPAIIALLLMPMSARAETITDLPTVIARLSSQEPAVIASALHTMARICDESCVPYVSDMMRHPDPEVVQAACATAKALANPRFYAPLLELVRNHPLDDIRVEAIKALTTTGYGYDALLLSIEPEHPNEVHRLILRSLPDDIALQKLPVFVEFAACHAYSSSVAEAYRDHPDELFQALVNSLPESTPDQLHNRLRTMLFIAPHLKNRVLSDEQIRVIQNLSDRENELIAPIQAFRATPDALAWILIHAPTLSMPTHAEALSILPKEAMTQVVDALLHDENAKLLNDMLSTPAVGSAIVENLPATAAGKARALTYLNTDSYRISAIYALQQFVDDDDILSLLTQELGSSQQKTAMAAMHALAGSPRSLQTLIGLLNSDLADDGFSRSYLAKWAVLLILSHHSTAIADAQRQQILELSRRQVLNPRLLHAEPALYTLLRLGESPGISRQDFENLRPDMKCAFLSAAAAPPQELLQSALSDSSPQVISAALEYISNHTEYSALIADTALQAWIESDIPMISVQASAASARLERTSCIPVLQTRLTHPDALIAYNALWALQKLRALPNEHWLKSLYYRAPKGLLRDRLGFLTGLDPNRTEKLPMSELYTGKHVTPGQIQQILTNGNPAPGQDIAIIQDDQSLRILRTNSFGMLIL